MRILGGLTKSTEPPIMAAAPKHPAAPINPHLHLLLFKAPLFSVAVRELKLKSRSNIICYISILR